MTTTTANNWHEANQQYLMAALEVVREGLERYKKSIEENGSEKGEINAEASIANKKLQQAADQLTAPSALDTLTEIFSLSNFEKNILLVCAGMELDSSYADLCGSIQNVKRNYPTFSLALAAFPDAHWDALTPDAALRYWRLINISEGGLITTASLRIDERILHYLVGIQQMDERLMGIIEPIFLTDNLVTSHCNLVDRLIKIWTHKNVEISSSIIHLCGEDVNTQRNIAATACDTLGSNLYAISTHLLPVNHTELYELMRLLEREMILSSSALFIDCNEKYTNDSARLSIITQFCKHFKGTLIIGSRKRIDFLQQSMIIFDVKNPTSDEQYTVWKNVLGNQITRMNGNLNAVISQFNMSSRTIRSAGSVLVGKLTTTELEEEEKSKVPLNILWDVCRELTRPQLGSLAQRLEPSATWDDLILPDYQKQTLKEIAIHLCQRAKVYGKWGFADKSSRGLGISALFTGESGTGKTMASEVLAKELHLDLYRIDLSQVVNKYIGETEKNLSLVFDEAEKGGAILLFDEADALFGKRSDVRDSHDRYANIEVSYLLQRIESYRGLAILTTNMKSALDKAFLRRIRFVVQFPFPDSAQRAEIWQRIFPSDTPTEGLDVNKLARLNLAGGNIRNIALKAAFYAADMGDSVRMGHLLKAAQREYSKIEKPLTGNETKGWI
ncbi:AAA ATPase, central domain protein [Candidatus Scalindua japonica]|uniref:AAA ATPase, central domain protein n=1 Tax=Candidatus Scalindua japonica TaxID=1284222 RepID=A0A286TW86_9BACT|nr:ATP-binding protein [Candidatus Scalindua japonica]GAX60149.1 AAA ATPase, central domain protein [Candidatus Scalindua japonica]